MHCYKLGVITRDMAAPIWYSAKSSKTLGYLKLGDVLYYLEDFTDDRLNLYKKVLSRLGIGYVSNYFIKQL